MVLFLPSISVSSPKGKNLLLVHQEQIVSFKNRQHFEDALSYRKQTGPSCSKHR